MATYQNERFANQRVDVDGNRYEACIFTDCRLVYRGGDKPSFSGCTFRQTNLQLEDAANRTAQYLQGLYGLGLAFGAERVLNSIEQGDVRAVGVPVPPPAEYTGQNYGKLGLYSAILAVIALLLGTALWYGYYYYPNQVVLNSDPARPLFNTPLLDLYPVLPESLAETYDAKRAAQQELLNSFGWVDQQGGIVHIPIDDAISIVAEAGVPAATGGGN